MLRKFITLVLVASALHGITAHADAGSVATATAAPAALVQVRLETSLGAIVLELERDRAPITTGNFLRYVDAKRFDGIAFYRAVNVAPGYALIQGGIRGATTQLFPPIKHEPTTVTGLSHVDGAISMARNEPGSASASFFITVGSIPSMDADPKATGDNLGFAVFGRVVEGMDIVRSILAAPVSPTEGEGVMKGQMLLQPVRIISAKRVP